jgi:hypothetical protein
MTPPAGTFMAPVRKGAIQFPPPFRQFCEAEGWDLFRILVAGEDHLILQPVLAGDVTDATPGFQASFTPDGKLWIPIELREAVSLGEQSVMMRAGDSVIHVYLRKVFDTLGFRPGH